MMIFIWKRGVKISTLFLIMMSSLSRNSRLLVEHLPRYSIYSGRLLSKKEVTVEHIIPKRLFKKKSHAHDLMNLAPCELYLNQKRSDYAFRSVMDLNVTCDMTPLHVPDILYCGFVSTRQRSFYPSLTYADLGLISRSILYMIHRYSYLESDLHEIIRNASLLDEWKGLPPRSHGFESERAAANALL